MACANEFSIKFYPKPGILKIVYPMSRKRKREKTIRRSPDIAALTSSLPAASFSGLPALVIIWNPPKIIRRNAMPPPSPTARLKNFVMNPWGSVGMQPIAVLTLLLSAQKILLVVVVISHFLVCGLQVSVEQHGAVESLGSQEASSLPQF